jgi:hypothetical protein
MRVTKISEALTRNGATTEFLPFEELSSSIEFDSAQFEIFPTVFVFVKCMPSHALRISIKEKFNAIIVLDTVDSRQVLEASDTSDNVDVLFAANTRLLANWLERGVASRLRTPLAVVVPHHHSNFAQATVEVARRGRHGVVGTHTTHPLSSVMAALPKRAHDELAVKWHDSRLSKSETTSCDTIHLSVAEFFVQLDVAFVPTGDVNKQFHPEFTP